VKFTTADCITDIHESLHEIKQSTINRCWRKLWPEAVHEAAVFPSINDDLQDIAQIAHQVGGEGFEDMQPHELEELIVSHTEEITEKDLEELINEDDSEDEKKVIARSTLNPKALTEIMNLQRALIDRVMECDPVMEMCLKFKTETENVSCPYLEIQKKLQKTAKQMTITRFFQPKPSVSASPNPPPPSPL
jgi:Mg/Co/Ni transporter MgtE